MAGTADIAWINSNFSPANIAGLKMWYKADSLALSDNDPVSTWTDSSGSGNHVTASGALRPTYKTNIQNGLPVVRFDGLANYLTGSFTNTYGSMFVVCQFNSASTFPDYNSVLITEDGVNFSDFFFIGNQGTTSLYTSGVPFAGNFWVNNVSTINLSPLSTMKLVAGVDPTPLSKIGVYVGFFNVGTPRLWDGDICEIIVYDTALSDPDRILVQDYLNAKWVLY